MKRGSAITSPVPPNIVLQQPSVVNKQKQSPFKAAANSPRLPKRKSFDLQRKNSRSSSPGSPSSSNDRFHNTSRIGSFEAMANQTKSSLIREESKKEFFQFMSERSSKNGKLQTK